MAFIERQTDRHTEVRATGVHNNEPHRLNRSRHKSRASIIHPESGLQGYFYGICWWSGSQFFVCHLDDMTVMAELKPVRKRLSEKGGNLKKLLKMLYLSSVLLTQYVFFQRKAKVKLRNYLKRIIEIVGNRAGKGFQTPFTTTFTICDKQQDSGPVQNFFKNKTKFFIGLCRTWVLLTFYVWDCMRHTDPCHPENNSAIHANVKENVRHF